MIEDGRPFALSVLLALGPHAGSELLTLHAVLRVIGGRQDAEVIVVEEQATPELRTTLARLAGHVRVLHEFPAHGTRGAIAAAAAIANGSVLAVVGDGVTPPADAFESLLAAFDADPGTGFVVPNLRCRTASAASFLAFKSPPLVAFTRLALDSIGGVGRIAALDAPQLAELESAPPVRDVLLPDALFDELVAAGWRRGVASTVLEHEDGLVLLERGVPSEERPERGRPYWSPPAIAPQHAPGLNVVGLLEAVCGIGDAGRRYVEAIDTARLPYATYAYHGHRSPERRFTHVGKQDFSYDTNLFVLNADLLLPFGLYGGEELWADRYTIGLWFWELEEINDTIRRGYRFVNELWASTNFIRDELARETDKTVRTVPLPVPRREGSPSRSGAELLMPDAFTFLTIFDFGSVAARKNSLGVVRAFCSAFTSGEGPVLLLKTLNAAWDPAGWQALLAEVGGRRDIVVLDGYLSDDAVSQMIGNADCYVSLHRAEGFGLTPAEAMAWGRPVIATRYSGNLDFMTDANSYLVGFDEGVVPDALSAVYPPGARWAEPRLDEAAAAMQEIYANPTAAKAKGLRGQRDIRQTHGVARVAAVIAARFDEIGRERSGVRTTQGRPARVARADGRGDPDAKRETKAVG